MGQSRGRTFESNGQPVDSKLEEQTCVKHMKHCQPVQDKNRRNQLALGTQLSQRIVCPLATTAIWLQIDRVHLFEEAQHISGIHYHAPPISVKHPTPLKCLKHPCPVLRSISYPHPSKYLPWWGFNRKRERCSSLLSSWMMLDASGQKKHRQPQACECKLVDTKWTQ